MDQVIEKFVRARNALKEIKSSQLRGEYSPIFRVLKGELAQAVKELVIAMNQYKPSAEYDIILTDPFGLTHAQEVVRRRKRRRLLTVLYQFMVSTLPQDYNNNKVV